MKKLKPDLPKLLVIMGHPRSGTSILNRVCNSHPDITMTREFFNMVLPRSYINHFYRIRKNFLRKNPLQYTPGSIKRKKLWSMIFFIRYMFWLLVDSRGYITVEGMQQTLGRLFPNVRIVGDKKPEYIWTLSNFEQMNTYYVLIYRDGRDVAQSIHAKILTEWKDEKWTRKKYSSFTKIATLWVSAIEMMEENADHIYIIRYEDLVTNPKEELARLAEYLKVDPAGFKPEIIRSSSIGKYNQVLTEDQIAEFVAIAGPTLERLSYLEKP